MRLETHVLFAGFFVLTALVAQPSTVRAQEAARPTPAAAPSDVESVDAVVAAVYDVISGPAGEERDWDRWRSLFIPEARLIWVGRGQDGTVRRRVMTPESYVEGARSAFERNGFFEEEIGRVQEEFGPVVHLFSTYQSKRALDDPEPFARGINSFQLYHDGHRWWVVTIYWTAEGPDLPIPEKYLSKKGEGPWISPG
jgi:hypothetical protein